MIGVLSSLWAAPAGALAARHPAAVIPAAVLAAQTWTTGWAALNLTVFAIAAIAITATRTERPAQ